MSIVYLSSSGIYPKGSRGWRLKWMTSDYMTHTKDYFTHWGAERALRRLRMKFEEA